MDELTLLQMYSPWKIGEFKGWSFEYPAAYSCPAYRKLDDDELMPVERFATTVYLALYSS